MSSIERARSDFARIPPKVVVGEFLNSAENGSWPVYIRMQIGYNTCHEKKDISENA